jgi:ABC-type spermidine/putrescine transport system permease subunit I
VGDWRFGSAISVILMVLVFISMLIFALVDRDKTDDDTHKEGGTLQNA